MLFWSAASGAMGICDFADAFVVFFREFFRYPEHAAGPQQGATLILRFAPSHHDLSDPIPTLV